MKAIGDNIGMFIKIDQSGVMGIDKLVRVRVLLDVRKPLVFCVRVKMKNGVEEIFDVKYERPPLFCFFCGKVGHGSKDCVEGGGGACLGDQVWRVVQSVALEGRGLEG